MSKRTKIRVFLAITALLITFIASSSAQPIRKELILEKKIAKVIKNCLPACVRIWGYDIIQGVRTSAQFSGVVANERGEIYTAGHTVQPGRHYKIFFPDGRECIGVAMGKIDLTASPGFPDAGLIVILEKGNWPYVKNGLSSQPSAGQGCIGISYPESLNMAFPTVRLGQVIAARNNIGFIQSACKMEPGDSGGPLFDLNGRLIGIHSAVDTAEDMNFEVPIEIFKNFASELTSGAVTNVLPSSSSIVRYKKSSKEIQLDKNRPSMLPDSKSQISVFSGANDKIDRQTGTLFYRDSLAGCKSVVVVKNSLLGQQPYLISQDMKIQLRCVLREPGLDVAVLIPEMPIAGGIKLNPISLAPMLKQGELVYWQGKDLKTRRSAVSSVDFTLPKVHSRPFLGAMVAEDSGVLRFSFLKPGGSAERAGIKLGDTLVSFGSKPIHSTQMFADELMLHWPGEKVVLSWKSKAGQISKSIIMEAAGLIPTKHLAERFAGGRSIRHDGFTQVSAHDGAVRWDECGGPLFDVRGKFAGINIARFSRTTTIYIPSKAILSLLQALELL